MSPGAIQREDKNRVHRYSVGMLLRQYCAMYILAAGAVYIIIIGDT